jgi:hypothetical protein
VTLRPVWHAPAERDLRDTPWQDAAWIASEVARLAEGGIGDVRIGERPDGGREFYLVLPGYRVSVTFDRVDKVVHVWRIFRRPAKA